MTDIYSQQRRNRRMTFALMLGFFLLVTLAGIGVDVYTSGGVDLGFLALQTLLRLLFEF